MSSSYPNAFVNAEYIERMRRVSTTLAAEHNVHRKSAGGSIFVATTEQVLFSPTPQEDQRDGQRAGGSYERDKIENRGLLSVDHALQRRVTAMMRTARAA